MYKKAPARFKSFPNMGLVLQDKYPKIEIT